MLTEDKNRTIIFVHYDKDGIVDEYVSAYLASLRKICGTLIFVSTAKLSDSELIKVTPFVDISILRENVGYDFFSYKAGLQKILDSHGRNCSEIVLCNDSVYGPLFPLEEMFSAMEKRDADFWGVTEAYEIAHHIQSYFMVFRRRVLDSKPFKDFWAEMQPISDREEVVRRYEVGLTQLLESNGFRSDVYVSTSDLNAKGYFKGIAAKVGKLPRMTFKELKAKAVKALTGRSSIHPNPTFILWKDMLLKKRDPFLKVSLLKNNPAGVDISDYREIVANNTNYDVGLIVRHLARMNHKDHSL